jgi:hypothetical protein
VRVVSEHEHEREPWPHWASSFAELPEDDWARIQRAYDVLTRVGQAAGEPWPDLVDRAHQALGVMLAMRAARDMR